MFTDSDYNQRQLRQMLGTLEDYEQGKTDLHPLISRLEGLLGCLEEPNSMWVDEFRHQWGILEEVYAEARYQAERTRTKPALSQRDIDLIQKTSTHLKALIESVIPGFNQ